MNEDDIKKLRHSFTNPYKEDMPKFKVNQFGHTILNSEENNIDIDSVEVKIDEFGEIKAEAKTSLFDNPNMISFFDKLAHNSKQESVEEETIQSMPNDDIYGLLLSELDEMDGTKKQNKVIPSPVKNVKNCTNKNCSFELPKEANYCMKCGTAQLSKFCAECGFSFKADEKFCPDCGTKR